MAKPAKQEDLSEVEIAKKKIADQASQLEADTAFNRADEVIKSLFPKATDLVREGVLKDERERKLSRQPRVGEKGNLFRTKRSGEVVDLETPEYWIEEYPDLAAAHQASKSNSGEVAIELAMSGVGNLSVQAQLVKEWGPERTAQLLALVGGELGKIKTVPNAGPGPAIKGAPTKDTNPWGAKGWNVTEQGRLTRVFGEEKARSFCKAAGATWGQTRPPKE